MLKSLALLFVLITTSAYANIGEIVQLSGKSGSAAIERGNDAIDTSKGTLIELMDTAITAKSKMRIDFVDDTRVDITEHSRLIIDDFVYDPNTGKGSLGLKASLGTVRYASGQIAKNSRQRVRIRTPSATIAVRGTDFAMVVDEAGGSMITLLPSCDTEGACFVGEISVETDAGIVVLNQAFQATIASNSMSPPTKPLILDIDESMINTLLILRKRNPYYEEEAKIEKKLREKADILKLDFLRYDGLSADILVDSIESIWVTALDQTDQLLQNLLYDMLDQLNEALMRLFEDELALQNQILLRQEGNVYGYDPDTGITLKNIGQNWQWERLDAEGKNFISLSLNQGYGYSLDIQQGDWEYYGYRLGESTNNNININQQ